MHKAQSMGDDYRGCDQNLKNRFPEMFRSFVRYYSDPKTNKILTENLDRGMYSMLDSNNADYTYATKDAMLKGMYENLLIDDKDTNRENFFKVVISAMDGSDTV
jgi:hypothetical protein